MMKKSLLSVGLLTMATLASVSHAQTFYVPTYTATNNNQNPITDMVLLWQDPQGGGLGLLSVTPEPGINIPGLGQTTTFQDLPKPRVPSGLFVMGLYKETIGEPSPGQEHVVLFMNSYAASLTKDIAWGTVFRNTLEDNLIADLHAVSATNDSHAVGDIFNFAGGDSMHIPDITSPTGDTTAWIAPPPNGTAAQGKIMMWSTGQEIGTFSASAVATPEPASLAVLAVGALALMRRKNRA